MIQLGYNIITDEPILVDMTITGHMCFVGGTGSGKSMAALYILYRLMYYARKNHEKIKLYIGDFKSSHDYQNISAYYKEYDGVTTLVEEFYNDYEQTEEGNHIIKILLIDEYAGYINWLIQNDKSKAERVKRLISSLLMTSRSRCCFVWCIQQRISASLFPAGIGAVDNFQICIGMGRLTPDSRKSLFASEHLEDKDFEENFHPKAGQGLILIDGQELQPVQIPYIRDKELLKKMLISVSKQCCLSTNE